MRQFKGAGEDACDDVCERRKISGASSGPSLVARANSGENQLAATHPSHSPVVFRQWNDGAHTANVTTEGRPNQMRILLGWQGPGHGLRNMLVGWRTPNFTPDDDRPVAGEAQNAAKGVESRLSILRFAKRQPSVTTLYGE